MIKKKTLRLLNCYANFTQVNDIAYDQKQHILLATIFTTEGSVALTTLQSEFTDILTIYSSQWV